MHWLLLALALPATAQQTPHTPHPPHQPPPTARIVYTGGSGAIGAERYNFVLHHALAAATDEVELVADRPLHGMLHQGPHVVWGADGTIASTLSLIEQKPKCTESRKGVALESELERALLPDAPSVEALQGVDRADVSEVVWHRCEAGGTVGWWVGPAEADAPEWRLSSFTVRLAAQYQLKQGDRQDPLYIVGLPQQEAGRRVAAIRDTLDAYDNAVFVDAGQFVPGASSVEYGAMSLHRSNGLDALASLEPAALVPSSSELAPGPDVLLEEAREHDLPYVATNWAAEDEALELPKHLRVMVGETDVAFLGFIDPEHNQIGVELEGTGVSLTDPVAAVVAEARELNAADDPPDVVVLIGLATPDMRVRMSDELRGIDLVIGDHHASASALDHITVDLGASADRERQPPVLLPMDGVSAASLNVTGGRLDRVRVEAVSVTADAPTDPSVSARITEVRAEVYPGRDGVLVPSPSDEPRGTVSRETLDRLVCEAVLESTGADAVFLPPLVEATEVPGSLTALQVADRLAMLDQLEMHKVDGDRMEAFLFQVQGEVDNHCGANVGARFAKVRGWYIDSNRTYKVVTTDRVRRTTDLGSILSSGSSDLALHHPKFRPVEGPDGQPALLSSVALDTLAAWQESGDEAWVPDVVGRGPGDKVPMWLLDVDQFAVRSSSFRRPERPEAYGKVPETKINSPSSFTLGADANIGVAYSDSRALWDVRGQAAYTRLSLADDAPQETADDWRASTSLSLPRLAFPGGDSLRFMPYSEVLFDSEFTPLSDDDGALLPRQADLSLTLGVSALRWRFIRGLRVGAFVNQDMGRLPDNKAGVDPKSPEYGSRLTAETRHDFFDASSLRLETVWDAMVFGNTPLDDDADLRFRLEGEARLKLRLIRWLDGALFADGLLVQGRVDSTRQLAGAMTFGFELDMAAAFRL